MKKMLLVLLIACAAVAAFAVDVGHSPFLGTWNVQWYVEDPSQPNLYWPLIDLHTVWIFTEKTLTYTDYDVFLISAKNKTVSYAYIWNDSNRPIDQHLHIIGVNIDFTYTRLSSTSQLDYQNGKGVVKTTPTDVIRVFMPKTKNVSGGNVAYMLELTRVK
jgi:hypothetical protein